jgi:hypothetical protein
MQFIALLIFRFLFRKGSFAMYLSANCRMPENTRDKAGGMRWQVSDWYAI